MFSNLEALFALAETGTMSKAAVRLHVSQSAVSKRIATLERDLGQKLVEPEGRRVKLTPFAERLLARAAPIVGDLKDILYGEAAVMRGKLVLAVSESVLASWGPVALQRVLAQLPEIHLEVHAHSSPMGIERVRAGEAMLAIVAGTDTTDLRTLKLIEEPMVIIPSRLAPFIPDDILPVLTIEAQSATWRCLSQRIERDSREWPFQITVRGTLQTFTGIAQMARAGFGHGLVPLSVARSLGIAEHHLFPLPAPGLTRPVSLIGRGSTIARPLVKAFTESLQQAVVAMNLAETITPPSTQVPLEPL
ncbi:LysR family transcriptional regulator [Sulfidibacter corallicola]|uniref:LysR family transcriptional regulator n=1 Tax=Sulfidibacter corallicola TaxID=2818388 RepID=A0A8A4TTD4_SULCO|nr:LysR family transcriptional regulator [Sulfidibacter corallicola]QTD53226.1 LysR family transcriptional regulator [Sulfidibacter corallicola]